MGKHPNNEEAANQRSSTQEEIKGNSRKLDQAAANARSVASLKGGRASNVAIRGNAAAGANAADKSSLFADIVSLRESNTSSR